MSLTDLERSEEPKRFCASLQSRDCSGPGELHTHTSLTQPTAFWEDSLPHSDDIQLSHSFLDPERKAMYVWFGVGGLDEQARIFSPLPSGSKLQPLFSFSIMPQTHPCQYWTDGFCLGG